MSQAKFDELRTRLAEIADLVKTASLLGWDQQVMMPPRGAAIRADANRLVNADEANLVRAARAAHVQLEAIRSLDLDTLPPHLAEIAELRLRHPSASLRELAAKARPPLSKASAHRRLQAVVKLVEN